MHSWFALHPVSPAVVEVRGLHQFDWRDGDAVTSVMRTIDEVQRSSLDYHQLYDEAAEREFRRIEASKPSMFSPLNYLKIHLPEVNLRGESHEVLICSELAPDAFALYSSSRSSGELSYSTTT
jgi:hypothetical protein